MILLSTIIGCATVLWIFRDYLAVRRDELAVHREESRGLRAVSEREVAVKEAEMQLRERAHEKPKAREQMPPDLISRTLKWEDEWAQEDERRYLNELYAELGNWDAVRNAVRPLANEEALP